MAKTIPLASHEVRWFFEGKAHQHAALKHWFETIAPMQKRPGVGPPVWQGRLHDQPDVYLLVPGVPCDGGMAACGRRGDAATLREGQRCSRMTVAISLMP